MDAATAAKNAGVAPEELAPALDMQRKAQWRLDYIAAENSMGFHAPQEAARILAESTDYARQGQALAQAKQLLKAGSGPAAVTPAPATPAPANAKPAH